MKTYKRLLLLILDGWGHGPDPKVSAIAQADVPFMDSLYKKFPNAELVTFGEEVGLPEGQMGNSEVGHLNIGAGRVVYQELARINRAVKNGELQNHPLLLKQLKHAKDAGKKVHFLGLFSDGGVHSHINHLKALCEAAELHGPDEIYVHAFLDGRDTDPKGGISYLKDMQDWLKNKKARIASLIGRYYAMDRDKRWSRIKLAYDMLVNGKGTLCDDLSAGLSKSYSEGVTDEFVLPLLQNAGEKALATIEEGDLVLCFNFRTDRCREITQVLTQEDFPEFGMHKIPLEYVTMTNYDHSFQGVKILFHKDDLQNTLGEILSNAGKSQVRIAETEKYPHVTYFFSGGREKPWPGEKRILIPSPKVTTYDLQPEMSALGITEAIMKEVEEGLPDFICLNFANTDMVGHTGVFEAAVKAAETVDECLSRLVPFALEHEYACLIIADHGNSDMMINPDGSPNTAHTMNPVPIIFVAEDAESFSVRNGKLADIAPSILTLLGMALPKEMDGKLLLERVGKVHN